MSFILDALKKSESERRRQSGPALLEMRIAPPRTGLPVWAIVLGLALLANLGILAYLLLRSDGAVSAPPVTLPPQAAVTPPPAAASTPTVTAAPVIALPAAPQTVLPEPELSPERTPSPGNSADFEPAIVPTGAPNLSPRPPPPTAAMLAADMGLPTIHDLNASGAGIPEMRLSLHAYDPDPNNRYVLLNSSRLREGESTADGARVERITEFGVILSWRGRRFTVLRGE